MQIVWKEIENMLEKSQNTIYVEKADGETRKILEKLVINEQSVLGQLVLNISQIVVNDYLRVFGGDSIVALNECVKKYYKGNKLIIAYDIFGGIYAIGNGDFAGETRNIWYFSPNSLRWEALEINYPQFIAWICSENIKDFYCDFLWKGMEIDIKSIKKNQGILIYPFLWAKECDIETAKKTIVPLEELIEINSNYRKKFFSAEL